MNPKESSGLSHFKWLDGQRLIFIFFFLFGSFGVIAVKEEGLGPIIAITFSIVVMLLYILYCGTRKYAVRADILGDNIYYLGFLFTLVSLAYTLYRFTSTDNEIDQIIQNFGIALSTTLVGVVGRVYFNQTRDEEEALADPIMIDSNALNFEDALHRSMMVIEAFGEQQEKSVEPLLNMVNTLQHTARAYSELSNAISSSTENMTQEMARFEEQYSKLNTLIQDRAAKSSESIATLQKGLKQIAHMVGEVEGSGRDIGKHE